MNSSQETIIEAEDYQIPAEAIMAPSTIPPTVFRGFESNLVNANDRVHAMLTDTFAKALLDVGFASHTIAAIISWMPMQRIIDEVLSAETRTIVMRGAIFGRRPDTVFKDIFSGRES